MKRNEIINSAYFNSLPDMLKESIMQSGIEFENEDEMRSFVANIEEYQQ